MREPCIRITRYPYEEPYHLRLRLQAWNGRLHGELEYYCNAKDLEILGNQLADFAGGRSAEIIYELGSEGPEDRFAFFLSMRVKPLDSCGHCAVIIRLNNNQAPPRGELSEFSIIAEVADVNRFGHLLIGFARLQHLALDWQVQEGRLIEEYEQVA